MNIELKLREIFRKSEEVFSQDDSRGNQDLVPFCNQILELYNNTDQKGVFEDIFIDDFDNQKECTWELAQLCMYHLKLPAYKEHLLAKLLVAKQTNDWRAIPVISDILNAYEYPWPDIDLFYE